MNIRQISLGLLMVGCGTETAESPFLERVESELGQSAVPPAPEIGLGITTVMDEACVQPGGTLHATAFNLRSDDGLVYFATTTAGTGYGPCFPVLGSICTELLDPVNYVGSAPSDGATCAEAELDIQIPNAMALGETVYVQAFVRRGVAGVDSVVSPVVAVPVCDVTDNLTGELVQQPALILSGCRNSGGGGSGSR